MLFLGDRRELPFVMLASLYLDIKIVHIAAGEYASGIPAYDQYIRPMLSIPSYFQITLSKKAKREVEKLFGGISYLKSNVRSIGNPIFEGVDKDKIKRIVHEEYDLVLLHPQSLSRKNTIRDIKEIEEEIKNKKTIFISGNKDKNYDLVDKFYNKMVKGNKKYEFVESLNTSKYFSLVKYCDRYFTNSSSISEIKYLNKKCLNVIGVRNKNRFDHELNKKAPQQLWQLLNKDFSTKLKTTSILKIKKG